MTAQKTFAAALLTLAIVFGPLTVESGEATVEDRPDRDAATAEAGSHETPDVAREPFRDCVECPALVIVEPGSFMMDWQDDPRCWSTSDPAVQVTIAYPLAVGVYEVTEDEWEACRREGGCFLEPPDGRYELANRPVTYVSWEDAQQYVRWLSAKTGEEYRLPSEAEWLYLASVAKGGTSWWSLSVDLVGSISDRYGLHGLDSGVMEWTGELASACLTGMPDAPGRKYEDMSILRGPSECWAPRAVDANYRWPERRDARGDCYGFRVVRSVGSGE